MKRTNTYLMWFIIFSNIHREKGACDRYKDPNKNVKWSIKRLLDHIHWHIMKHINSVWPKYTEDTHYHICLVTNWWDVATCTPHPFYSLTKLCFGGFWLFFLMCRVHWAAPLVSPPPPPPFFSPPPPPLLISMFHISAPAPRGGPFPLATTDNTFIVGFVFSGMFNITSEIYLSRCIPALCFTHVTFVYDILRNKGACGRHTKHEDINNTRCRHFRQ